jgi:hypothetical protein
LGGYAPEVDPEFGVEPDDGAVPGPVGGAPVWVPEPLPMLGQFFEELEPALVLPDPVLPVPVLDDGEVVDELVEEPVPELPVVVDVVAALATSAPPATRPEVSAPVASTLRKRNDMGVCPFIS